MKHLMWLLKWILKAAIFFTLFAFALNNQHDATVHFFFGTRWSAPLVLVVLAAFTCGVAIGVLGMVPRWWKHRSAAHKAARAAGLPTAETMAPSELPATLPRHGS
jgi:lipopolysaccharide assembly protein A